MTTTVINNGEGEETAANNAVNQLNKSVKCIKCQRTLECEQIDHKRSPGKLIIVSPLPFLPVLTFNICSNCCGMILDMLRDVPKDNSPGIGRRNSYISFGIG